jgi:signal transduction histidine kinase
MARAVCVGYHGHMADILMQDIEMKPRDWALDTGLALVVFFFGCLQLVLAFSTIVFTDESFREFMGYVSIAPTPAAYAVVALTTLPVVMRRRFMWLVYALVFGVYILMQGYFTGYSLSILGPMVALYTIARHRPRTEIIVACVIALVLLLVMPMPAQNYNMAIILRLQNIAYMGMAAVAGFAVRSYAGMLAQSRERAVEAERTREEEAAKRVEAERVRIAREIHDITAHSLSAVSIQAAAAERIVGRDPQQAREIMGQVRTTSKSALDEIRAMIGALRNEESPAETEPAEGTDRLPDLVRYAEEAGIAVSFDKGRYDKARTPAFADLALFAIAREAVTNVVRHARATHMGLNVGVGDDGAYVEVTDDGDGMVGCGAQRAGHGLKGMEERAKALHGTLTYGNRPEGGFVVRAVIPLASKEPTELER